MLFRISGDFYQGKNFQNHTSISKDPPLIQTNWGPQPNRLLHSLILIIGNIKIRKLLACPKYFMVIRSPSLSQGPYGLMIMMIILCYVEKVESAICRQARGGAAGGDVAVTLALACATATATATIAANSERRPSWRLRLDPTNKVLATTATRDCLSFLSVHTSK